MAVGYTDVDFCMYKNMCVGNTEFKFKLYSTTWFYQIKLRRISTLNYSCILLKPSNSKYYSWQHWLCIHLFVEKHRNQSHYFISPIPIVSQSYQNFWIVKIYFKQNSEGVIFRVIGSQCQNFQIFLPPRFYVKPIWQILSLNYCHFDLFNNSEFWNFWNS